MTSSTFNTFTARIYLVALILRLIPALLSRGLGIGLDDMFQYDMLARSLVAGNGYRWYAQEDLRQLEPYVDFDLGSADYDPVRGVQTSFRAPLYPVLLAAVYSLSGTGFERFFAARLAQAILLGAPLAPLTYLTGRRIFSDDRHMDGVAKERAARLAAWAIAVYPILVIFPLGLGTENLFFPLLLLALYVLLGAAENPSSRRFWLTGFLLGLAALTRSVILPFAVLAALWIWLRVRRPDGAAWMLLALVITILPWVVRNTLLHGKLTGVETALGYNLYVGYHPLSSGTFTFGPSLDLVPILDDSVRDTQGTQRAIEFVRSDPGRFVPLAVSRLGHFFRMELRVLTFFYGANFFGYLPVPALLLLAAIFGLPFAFVAISAAFGAALLRGGERGVLLVLLFVGYLIPHVLILSEERFHLALLPFLAILAARLWIARAGDRGALAALAARYADSPGGRLAVSLACLAAFLLVLNWGYQLGSDAQKFAILLGPHGNESYFPY